MTIAGVVRFTEPALSSGPHSVGAHFSLNGLSFTGDGGCCALMYDTPTRPRTTTPTRTASRERLAMSTSQRCGLKVAPMVRPSKVCGHGGPLTTRENANSLGP